MAKSEHSATVAPKSGEETLQLALPVVLPGVDDAQDGCVGRLQDRMRGQTGITQAHLESLHGQSVLCLHYDPNLVPLSRLERLVRDEGSEIVERYRHETIPVRGMDCASCAAGIEHVVKKLPGVLNVSVNYAIQKMKVEYDSTQIQRDNITKAVKKLGYRIEDSRSSTANIALTPKHDHHEHDHAHHDHERGHNCDGHDHAHNDHHGHDHSGHSHDHDVNADAGWLRRNPELTLSFLSGILLVLGFCSENFLHLPMPVALVFYCGAYVAGGYDLARHTIPTTLQGRFDVEFLMLAGAAGAAILGQWAEGAFLLFLFSFGHALEHYAMERARNAIEALGQLTPKIARIRRGETELEVPVEAVLIGDTALVRPGDRIAVDGTIRKGHSAVDQSPITGESVPVEKAVGEGVFAGSINGDGAIEVEVTRLAQDTTMARVVKMVEEAQTQKAPSQTFSENFERIFVPAVLGVVVLAIFVPPVLGWLTWREAIMRAISTLVAASPCALALATPAAVLAGIGQAARNGVLIKGGVHLENLGSLNAIAFDKTGTITRGRPEVTDVITVDGFSEIDLLRLAAAVEARSSHPLAQAVVHRAQSQNLALSSAGELQTLGGRGVESEVEGQIVRIGNMRLFEEKRLNVPPNIADLVQKWGEAGKPIMIVSLGERVVGALALSDQLRDETSSALKALRDLGIQSLIMLTGDNQRVAQNIARSAGLTEVRADLLPENKVEAIKELIQRHGQVAMIGDGVNDAPALANATVGIAMGAGGTDVALETADVALMADDLSKLPFAVALSRQSRRIIRQNLWISLGVICILVPSTLFGFARLGVAVIFHEGSTLVVVMNALRLLNFRLKQP